MQNKPKYLVRPGYIRSINDGDLHFITSSMLMNLYQVKREECVIDYKGFKDSYGKLIALDPRYDGDYSIKETV